MTIFSDSLYVVYCCEPLNDGAFNFFDVMIGNY